MTTDLHKDAVRQLFGSLPDEMSFSPAQKLYYQFVDLMRNLAMTYPLSEVDSKLVQDYKTDLHTFLRPMMNGAAPASIGTTVAHIPRKRSRSRSRGNGHSNGKIAGEHTLIAQRIVAPIDPKVHADRKELVKYLKHDPGFTGWIALENNKIIQGVKATAESLRVFYDREKTLAIFKARDLLK